LTAFRFSNAAGGDEVNIVEKRKKLRLGENQPRNETRRNGNADCRVFSGSRSGKRNVLSRRALFPEFKNNFFFGALKGEAIIRLVLDGRKIVVRKSLLLKLTDAFAKSPKRRRLDLFFDFEPRRARRLSRATLSVLGTDDRSGREQLDEIVKHHTEFSSNSKLTGERVKITMMVGNHDYDLACYPEFKDKLKNTTSGSTRRWRCARNRRQKNLDRTRAADRPV
jgi:hypothetical protein